LATARARTTACRRRQLLDTGSVGDGVIAPALRHSWQRCNGYGLAPTPHAWCATRLAAQLARAMDHQHELVSHARPVMNSSSSKTRETDSMVILATHKACCSSRWRRQFLDRAERVALRPGANWHEQWRAPTPSARPSPNATVVVHAGEHFSKRNGFLPARPRQSPPHGAAV